MKVQRQLLKMQMM